MAGPLHAAVAACTGETRGVFDDMGLRPIRSPVPGPLRGGGWQIRCAMPVPSATLDGDRLRRSFLFGFS
jgi:hypothetical protein